MQASTKEEEDQTRMGNADVITNGGFLFDCWRTEHWEVRLLCDVIIEHPPAFIRFVRMQKGFLRIQA